MGDEREKETSSALAAVDAPRGLVVLMLVEAGMGTARMRSESSLNDELTYSGVTPKS